MEVEICEVRKTFETNLFSVITMCQTFLPLLIKAKGTIVQIGSVAGVRQSLVSFTVVEKMYTDGQ
jgi:1-acylglycerone phosphate reductase